MPIKVLIYDDNTHLRNSIKTLLQWNTDFEVTAALPNAITVIDDVKALQPDVIIMDIDMPPSNGVEAVKELRAADISIPIIMLTVFEDNDNIVNAICAGARLLYEAILLWEVFQFFSNPFSCQLYIFSVLLEKLSAANSTEIEF